MSTFETNINKLEKALENIKSVKGRVYANTSFNNKKASDIVKNLNEAINALDSAKSDYNTMIKAEEECKKNTMSEEEFKKVFKIVKSSDRIYRCFNESEIGFIKETANKAMYKTYCNLMRDKFNLDPISKFDKVGDISKYRAEYDEKEKKVKIKDDDGKAIAEYKPEFGSNLAITRLEIKDKEGHVLYQKDCSKVDIKKPIVLKITDDDIKNLIYNREGAVLYNHHTEAIELMWNLSVQENVCSYGFSVINLNRRYSFFEKVYEFSPDTEISLKAFKDGFMNELNKRIDDIVHDIKTYLDSARDKEIEILFE